VIEHVWRTEKIQQWEEGLICPILKKGNSLVCENYFAITLLNNAYKVFSNILFETLQPYAEKKLLGVTNVDSGWHINIKSDTHGWTDYGKDGKVLDQYIFTYLWTSKLPMAVLTEMSSSKL
jgi:hypothetical protein